jgi:hypothetical protein
MQITLTIFGSCTVTLTGEKHQDLWEQAAFFHSLPETCPYQVEAGKECGAPLIITCRHPKNIAYYGLLCQGTPAHECDISEYRDKSGLYWKGNFGDHAFKSAYGTPRDRRGEREPVDEPAPDRSAREGARSGRDGAADKSAEGWNCSPKNQKQVLSLWESAAQLGATETRLRRMLGIFGCTSRKELTDDQAMEFSRELAALVRELNSSSAAKSAGARPG